MLDFVSLQKQLNDMVREQKSTHRSYTDKVDIAQGKLNEWAERWKELVDKLKKSRTSWLLADDIHEPLNQRYPLSPCPKDITVIATDGSQIFPDRHELASCHLINIGTVVLYYGTGERPILTSRPELHYKEEETYREWNGKRIPVTTEIISALRGAREIEELTNFAETAAHEQRNVIGLMDGTLILWTLAGKPQNFEDEILRSYFKSFNQLKSLHIPFAGYISHPTSADVVNVLRVAICPEDRTNCDRCPYKDNNSELPCEPIAGVTDAILFSSVLKKGERTPLFKSKSEILKKYKEHEVYFFYLHVGSEIARIEIPKWIAQDSELLQCVHAVAYDQAQKGQGYPVSLSEAHEQAVIRGNEREQFYRIIERMYVQEGVKVNLSRKNLKKRNVSI